MNRIPNQKKKIARLKSIIENEGLLEGMKAVLRYANFNHRGYYYYLYYKYRVLKGTATPKESDVFQTIPVNPSSVFIKNKNSIGFDKWMDIGEIKSGGWDKEPVRFENSSVYRAMNERFEKNSDWADVGRVKTSLQKVRNGETTWNGCRTEEDVWDRCAELDRIYESIKQGGFKSQEQIHGKSIKKSLLSGSFSRSQTDIAVHVGRNGQFLSCDGGHRLSMARILDLKKVPVRVVVRHKIWEGRRQKMRNSGEYEDNKLFETQNISHPDFRVNNHE